MTCAAFAVALLAGVAYADQPPVIPRIGVLMPPVTSIELLKTARAPLGLTIPESIFLQADEVIR